MIKKSDIQIFLAHASEDKQAVLKLYDRLKQAGYKPWLDKKDLIPGQNWRSIIPKAIAQSQLFIACLSSRSITKQGFVQREFKMALNQAADRPPNSIYIIPIRLDDCEIPNLRQEEYGLNLRDIHWLDYWEADGFDNLERAIKYQYGSFAQDKSVTHDQDFTEYLGNGVNLEMIAIPGGTFLMGTEDQEIERLCKEYDNEWFKTEKPQHKVTVPSFLMGKYPVTQAQWRSIASLPKVARDLQANPSYFKGDNLPVECVSWDDAQEFCKRLSQRTKRKYRLPSEAEWEYACRSVTSPLYKGDQGGSYPPFHFGKTISTELANHDGNYVYGAGVKGLYREETTKVGIFPANKFGLYDMHGNVWEWCEDDWHKNYQGAPNDGRAWLKETSSTEAIRGGSWENYPHNCRSAIRSDDTRDNRIDNIGFRVVCVAPRTT